MAPCSFFFDTIQMCVKSEILNGLENTIFTPFTREQACLPPSDKVHANAFSLAVAV